MLDRERWELLDRGADPDAGSSAPDAALCAVSFDRDSHALWEAVMQGSTEMTEALLFTGFRLGVGGQLGG